MVQIYQLFWQFQSGLHYKQIIIYNLIWKYYLHWITLRLVNFWHLFQIDQKHAFKISRDTLNDFSHIAKIAYINKLENFPLYIRTKIIPFHVTLHLHRIDVVMCAGFSSGISMSRRTRFRIWETATLLPKLMATPFRFLPW